MICMSGSALKLINSSILLICLSLSTNAKELITRKEASLPDYHSAKAVFPGPKIIQLSPDPNVIQIRSPIRFRFKFEPRGSQIDIASLKVIYLKVPSVDLTDRIKEYASPNGIDMPNAELPTGDHQIRIEVSDIGGLIGRTEIVLRVRE